MRRERTRLYRALQRKEVLRCTVIRLAKRWAILAASDTGTETTAVAKKHVVRGTFARNRRKEHQGVSRSLSAIWIVQNDLKITFQKKLRDAEQDRSDLAERHSAWRAWQIGLDPGEGRFRR